MKKLSIYSEIVPASPLDCAEDQSLYCGTDGEQKYLHPECGAVFCLFCEDGCPGCDRPTI